MAGYDIEGARKAGVSDGEIADALAPKMNYDIAGARKAGVPDAEIADALVQKFNTTPGGAATSNPNLQRQGDMQLRQGTIGAGESLGRIGFSGALGALSGFAAPEILQGAAGVASRFAPQAAPFLSNMGNILRTQRGTAAVSGGISGVASEVAGQGVEAAGGGPGAVFAAQLIAGGITPEMAPLVSIAARKVAGMPVVADSISALKKALGKDPNLTAEQEAFVRNQIDLLRGGPKAPLDTTRQMETIGGAMGAEGERGVQEATKRAAEAQKQLLGVGKIDPSVRGQELTDIGNELRNVIVKRNQTAIDARKAQYAQNEKMRDAIVTAREKAGQTVDTTPEYQALISSLKSELKPGLHSPDVASDFENILRQITTKAKPQEQPFGGMGGDPFAVIGEKKPSVSFQQIDEVRRQLGEVFRGKPPEGYKAIDAQTARRYYARLSDLQKRFAGGPDGPQAKLLDDYAASTEGMDVFRSKVGQRATALDKFDDSQFATDAAALPTSYFKTRGSVQALRELTGDDAIVNKAALEFANRKLEGSDAAGVRKFMYDNAEWVNTLTPLRMRLENYAGRLDAAERSTRNATAFVKEMDDAKGLLTKGFPAQRAIDLIQGGTPELWAKAGPAIAKSPQARVQVADAVARLMAEKAERSSSNLVNFYAVKVRPGVESSGLASKAELDYILERLVAIETKNMPEPEKLGAMRRIILQSANGWSSSETSKDGTKAYKWMREKVVPD